EVTITTGSGNDTVYTDNSGTDNTNGMAKWLFNAVNTDINDIQGKGSATNYFLQDAKLTVTFSAGSTGAGVTAAVADALSNGFESTVTVGTTNGAANAADINQAIKSAINDNAVLSKYLKAE